MGWTSTVTFFAIVAVCVPAVAQVHRCKDVAGKTIYSDTPCATGQAGMMIERQKSRVEILEERLQAAESNERKYRERALEQQMQSQQSASQAAARQPEQKDKSLSYECRQAQREHETVSSIRTGTDEERRNRINSATQKTNASCGLQTEMLQPPAKIIVPAHVDPRPAIFTNCNAGFCYDNKGGVYHRNGPNFMTGPNGRVCHRAGNMWNCN